MSLSLNEFLQSENMQRLSLIQQVLIGAWDLHHYDVMRKVLLISGTYFWNLAYCKYPFLKLVIDSFNTT